MEKNRRRISDRFPKNWGTDSRIYWQTHRPTIRRTDVAKSNRLVTLLIYTYTSPMLPTGCYSLCGQLNIPCLGYKNLDNSKSNQVEKFKFSRRNRVCICVSGGGLRAMPLIWYLACEIKKSQSFSYLTFLTCFVLL